jgi:hypothetical protein
MLAMDKIVNKVARQMPSLIKTPRNSNGRGYNSSRNGNRGNRYSSFTGQQEYIFSNCCNMCGLQDQIATDGCPNLVNYIGCPIQAHPCQNYLP